MTPIGNSSPRWPAAFIALAFAACSRAPSDYHYQRPHRSLFYSDFASPTEDFWTGKDGHQTGTVVDGDYQFLSVKAEPRFNAPAFPVGAGQDFEVEAAVAGPSDRPDGEFGIVVGDFSGKESFLYFEVTRSGRYSIVLNHVLSEGKLADRSARAYRKLTVRRIGSQAYFFVDEQYLLSYPLPQIATFRAGVFTGQATVVWADYFRVSQYE